MFISEISNQTAPRRTFVLFYAAALLLLFALANQAQTTAFVQQAKLLASDGAAQDSHGFAVAISGDTAVVGAPRNTGGSGLQSRGAAYVYVRSAAGAWTQQQKLTPSDGAATDQFGYSVAINGNTIAVGRYNTTTGLNRADGKVYIFTRTGTTWTETQTLQSNDIAQGDLFGNSLAFENDTLAVGALTKNNGNNFAQGAAYVFTRPGAGGAFAQQAKLISNDGGLADFFGYSIALSGNTVVIGTPGQVGSGAASGRGWAYVFTRSGAAWSFQQKLLASDGASGDAFGFSVAISGETVVVGARLDVVGSAGEVGSAYVFNRTGTAWTEAQKLTAAEATPRNDTFGGSVAIKGDTIAIGSPAHEYIGTIANHGAVYVFTRAAGGSFARVQKLVHDDPAPDALGTSVAFDGNSIISGAPSKDSARGATYIFASLGANIQKIADSGGATSDQFGSEVAVSGDTMVIGSREDQIGTNLRQGSASVYVKNSAGIWIFQQKLVAADGALDDQIGEQNSIAIEGDTIVLGAGLEDSGATTNNGAAYVFTRSNGIWTQRAKLLASDPTAGAQFGAATAISGGTIVVGASNYGTGAANRGAVYVFTGAGATWTEQARITAADAAAQDFLGTDVQISGDTIFAAAEGVNSRRGAVYVFNRAGATWTQGQKLLASDGANSDEFGSSVALRGDEAMIGARKGGTQDRGAVYYFTRTGGAWTEQQIIQPTNAASSSAEFGESVDFSSTTAIIGAEFDALPTGVSGSGAAYIFRKAGETWTQAQKFVPLDAQSFTSLGRNVALSGTQGIATASALRVNGQNGAGAVYAFSTGSVSRVPFDFDGDGKADLSVFRPSNGTWYLQNSTSGFSGAQFGANGDRIVPADYDGDGKTDIAVFRSGIWYLNRSQAGFTGINFGAPDDIPVPADYDGDGKADVAVYRPSNGTWYLQRSQLGFTGIQFGAAGDKPTIGDFDGDAKADVAVFRPSNGGWYRINSSNGQNATVQFGIAEDLIVPADYDGDGKTDVAVFRPSSGTWYLQRSQLGFIGITFGQTGDKPVAADYDGDGKADVAVYRAGIWYLNRSTAGFTGVSFGAGEDLPAPNAFVR